MELALMQPDEHNQVILYIVYWNTIDTIRTENLEMFG